MMESVMPNDTAFFCTNHFFLYIGSNKDIIMFGYEKEFIRTIWVNPNYSNYNAGYNRSFINYEIQPPENIRTFDSINLLIEFIISSHKEIAKYNAFL